MATLTYTVGGTTPDYTTIALAEASIPANMVTDGNQRRFQCRDVTFAESDIVWGGGVTTDATNFPALEAESGSAFNGIAGNGPVIDATSGTSTTNGNVFEFACDYGELINIEVTNSQTQNTGNNSKFGLVLYHPTAADFCRMERCILRDNLASDTRCYGLTTADSAGTFYCLNTIFYAIGSASVEGRGANISVWGAGATWWFIGNSLLNTGRTGGYGVSFSYDNGVASTGHYYNNLAISLGTDVDYANVNAGASTLNASNNGSGDATAFGTSTQTGLTDSTEFVSATVGSEDLHLKSGATSISSGSDRGTTPAGVELDIDNYNRDTGAGIWDIGADQLLGDNPHTAYVRRYYSLITR